MVNTETQIEDENAFLWPNDIPVLLLLLLLL